MKLFEEFKEYTEMWDTLIEWVDGNGNKVQLNKNTPTPVSSTSNKNNNNLYIIFNYYTPDDLDDFCLLHVGTNKTDAVTDLIDMAEQSVENYGRYKNTLVCYKIDPDSYDMTVDEFIDASESKHDYCGEGLHHEYTDVVYALSSIAANEKPLYELDGPIVEIEFYDKFLSQPNNPTGLTIDDIYDSNFDSSIINKIYNEPEFQKFMKDKLSKDINNAL